MSCRFAPSHIIPEWSAQILNPTNNALRRPVGSNEEIRHEKLKME